MATRVGMDHQGDGARGPRARDAVRARHGGRGRRPAAGSPGSWREQRLLGQISAGAVVVLHEGTDERRDVVDTLDWLLTRLAERGLRSVTLTELSRL